MTSLAAAAARSSTTAAFHGVSASASATASPAVNWEDFNYPCAREPCNLLHFDLEELKAKQGERLHNCVRLVHRWWLLCMGIVTLNFVNTFIITLGVDNSKIFSGVNVLYSIFNIIIAFVAGLYTVYNAYKGLSIPSPKAKRNAQVMLVLLLILSLTQAFMGAGNANGFGNLGAVRMDAAKALDLGIVGYWTAMTVIESLLWLASVGLGCFAAHTLWVN